MGIETIILGVLAGVTAITGITTGVVSGVSANRAAKQQAAQVELQSAAEGLQAAIDENNRQRNLKRALATQNAIFAGSNIDLGSGTPSILAATTFEDSQRESSRNALFSQTRLSILDSQRSDILARGQTSLTSGILQGVGAAAQAGLGVASIGKVPKGSNVGTLSGGEIYTGGIA